MRRKKELSEETAGRQPESAAAHRGQGGARRSTLSSAWTLSPSHPSAHRPPVSPEGSPFRFSRIDLPAQLRPLPLGPDHPHLSRTGPAAVCSPRMARAALWKHASHQLLSAQHPPGLPLSPMKPGVPIEAYTSLPGPAPTDFPNLLCWPSPSIQSSPPGLLPVP